ncbi:MAG: carbohydrate ABC transporter permease [Clostridia bacterium]|nr:carbohydrate ABC transporter permease [Clostridia bacterium]
MDNAKQIKTSRGDFWYTTIITVILVVIGLVAVFPMVAELALSFSSKAAADTKSVTIYPKDFTLDSWKYMLSQMSLWKSSLISLSSTAIGILLALIVNVLLAYPLSKKDFPLRKILMLLIVFTMVFKAPVVPYYLQIARLGLKNNYWVLIFPHILNAYNLIVMRTFFQAFPKEIEEAATIDGCGKFMTLLKVVLPSSKPVLTTVGLFYGVTMWNQYQNPLMFISKNDLFPMQLRIRQILNSGADITAIVRTADVNYTATTLGAVVVIFAIVPILCIYPFLQKHFNKGAMLGSVKG